MMLHEIRHEVFDRVPRWTQRMLPSPHSDRPGGAVRRPSIVTRTLAASVLIAICFVVLIALLPHAAYADECPAGGNHTYSVIIVSHATEDDEGLRRFTCTKCGYVFDQAIPATGHLWGPWTVEVEPTCTSEGSEYRVCAKYPDHPHYEYRLLYPLSPTAEHAFEVIDQKEATCTEQGYRVLVCGICGDAITEETDVLGHEWGEWIVDVEPTATEEGRRYRVCLHDEEHVEYEVVPPVGAAFDSQPEPSRAPIVVSDSGEDDEQGVGFWSGPNAVDAVLLGADFTAIVVFFLFAIPLLFQRKWIKGRRAKAIEQFRAQAAEKAKKQRLERRRP